MAKLLTKYGSLLSPCSKHAWGSSFLQWAESATSLNRNLSKRCPNILAAEFSPSIPNRPITLGCRLPNVSAPDFPWIFGTRKLRESPSPKMRLWLPATFAILPIWAWRLLIHGQRELVDSLV